MEESIPRSNILTTVTNTLAWIEPEGISILYTSKDGYPRLRTFITTGTSSGTEIETDVENFADYADSDDYADIAETDYDGAMFPSCNSPAAICGECTV